MDNNSNRKAEQRAKKFCKVTYSAIVLFILCEWSIDWMYKGCTEISIRALFIFFPSAAALIWCFIERIMEDDRYNGNDENSSGDDD